MKPDILQMKPYIQQMKPDIWQIKPDIRPDTGYQKAGYPVQSYS